MATKPGANGGSRSSVPVWSDAQPTEGTVETTDPLDQLFDVVDEHDVVLHQAPRGEVHARLWLHRAVHVFVITPAGRLHLQRRSATKEHAPLKLDSSASGHVDAGETYDVAAVRELAEEMGISAAVTPLQKFRASPETAYEHTWLYVAYSDAPPVFHPVEICEVLTLTPDEVALRIETNREDFTVCFQVLFDWFHREWWPGQRPGPG